MRYALGILFVVSVAYSVLGNAAVGFVLARRKVPFSFMLSGVPGYLYRRCVASPHLAGLTLTRFALSTVVALFVVPLAAIGFFATLPSVD